MSCSVEPLGSQRKVEVIVKSKLSLRVSSYSFGLRSMMFGTALILMSVSIPNLALAESSKPELFAKCSTADETLSNATKVYEFYGFGRPDGYAKIIDIERVTIVRAEFLPASWISFKASFADSGKLVVIEFSNFLSPSVGKMRIDGVQAGPIACLLPES